jgi:hypothetical protein
VHPESAGPLERWPPPVEAEGLEAVRGDQVGSALRRVKYDYTCRQLVESTAPQDPVAGALEATAPGESLPGEAVVQFLREHR